jgi:hypothetical protein
MNKCPPSEKAYREALYILESLHIPESTHISAMQVVVCFKANILCNINDVSAVHNWINVNQVPAVRLGLSVTPTCQRNKDLFNL